MPKVTYIKDFDYDVKVIYYMLHGKDPSGVENRAKGMDINKKLLDLIQKANNYEEIKDHLIKVGQARYEENDHIINKALKNYQVEWNKINDNYFETIAKITKHSWKFAEYYVVVSPFHRGVSTFGGDKVVRSCYEDPKEQLRITAHEILMSHLWNLFFELYPKSKEDNDKRFWAANELLTNCLLGLEPDLLKLWPKYYQTYDEYLRNYPQLTEAKMKLKKLYPNKKSFEDIIKTTLQLIDKTKLEY